MRRGTVENLRKAVVSLSSVFILLCMARILTMGDDGLVEVRRLERDHG
jgi:hypothetical protein